MRPIEEGEFEIFNSTEDAPQIVGIVDERGPVDFSDSKRWKIIADDGQGDITITSKARENTDGRDSKDAFESDHEFTSKRNGQSHDHGSKSTRIGSKNSDVDLNSLKKKKHRPNSKMGDEHESKDLSPPRKSKKSSDDENCSRSKKCSDDDLSPPRRHKMCSDDDFSPPRKHKRRSSDVRPPRRHKMCSDDDLSPPRKHKRRSDDLSPPRRSRKCSDDDLSPPRKHSKCSDDDLSPPRKSSSKHHRSKESRSRWSNDKNISQKHKQYADGNTDSEKMKSKSRCDDKYDKHLKNSKTLSSRSKTNSDNDLDPPRKSKNKHNFDQSQDTSRIQKDHDGDFELSSRKKKYSDDDLSPERTFRYKRKGSGYISDDLNAPGPSKSLHRNSRKEKRNFSSQSDRSTDSASEDSSMYSTSKQSNKQKVNRRARSPNDSQSGDNRMKKTLDGKTAGLSDAKALREETEAYKKREKELFNKLSTEVTGKGQAAILRDRKTGKRRDLAAEAAEKREKEEKDREEEEKYARWGRGLKQIGDQEEKLKRDLYEMSKPLARYADDADLDKELREQEREGDPMLEYIKQKQIKEGKRKPDLPKYEGSFMPNRFGIKPGHRWDGVDRSNGYEKQWFEAQNAKKAIQEEAYKWSTADM
ncbi:BUD13 homolog isoform X2 [Orussus abietinus]|nr:BUD13 homolog isoform X2 [Orussus abietinus]XP_012277243.1 BUD13 homolog isoform X2 [Orussus abietinus]